VPEDQFQHQRYRSYKKRQDISGSIIMDPGQALKLQHTLSLSTDRDRYIDGLARTH